MRCALKAETVRMNITLPRYLVEALDVLAGSRKRSQFISEAVRFRIQELEKEKLEALLTEGYQSTKKEGLDIASEFEQIDTEGWDEY